VRSAIAYLTWGKGFVAAFVLVDARWAATLAGVKSKGLREATHRQ
jgi:hypothetical protein